MGPTAKNVIIRVGIVSIKTSVATSTGRVWKVVILVTLVTCVKQVLSQTVIGTHVYTHNLIGSDAVLAELYDNKQCSSLKAVSIFDLVFDWFEVWAIVNVMYENSYEREMSII